MGEILMRKEILNDALHLFKKIPYYERTGKIENLHLICLLLILIITNIGLMTILVFAMKNKTL